MSHYRAGASTILNRLLEESSAGFPGADVVQITGTEMVVLDDEGLLLPLETPVREDILQAGRFDTWLAPYVNAFVAGWNTDRVAADKRPTTWEEVLRFDGVLSMDVDDFEWFATLVEGHFMEEKGMTEEEAVQLFKDAAQNAIIVNGHSIGSQMLVAGEFDVNATMYHHHTARFPESAPLGWEPPVEPILVTPNGVGILSSTDRPATALLFLEFMLTDGQPLLVESGRTPGSTMVEGGLSPEYATCASTWSAWARNATSGRTSTTRSSGSLVTRSWNRESPSALTLTPPRPIAPYASQLRRPGGRKSGGRWAGLRPLLTTHERGSPQLHAAVRTRPEP